MTTANPRNSGRSIEVAAASRPIFVDPETNAAYVLIRADQFGGCDPCSPRKGTIAASIPRSIESSATRDGTILSWTSMATDEENKS